MVVILSDVAASRHAVKGSLRWSLPRRLSKTYRAQNRKRGPQFVVPVTNANQQALVEQIQLIRGIIHVVDAISDRNQTEQRSAARRVAAAIEQVHRDLLPIGSGLDHKTVIAIRCEDVPAPRHSQ